MLPGAPGNISVRLRIESTSQKRECLFVRAVRRFCIVSVRPIMIGEGVAGLRVRMNDDLIVSCQCRNDTIHDFRRSGVISAAKMQHERPMDFPRRVEEIVNSCAVIANGRIGIRVCRREIGDRAA